MHRNERGFTLLEILIALFIFTIISLILSQSLRNVIGIAEHTASYASRLRQLQLVWLIIGRDIEQTVDRPVLKANGQEEQSFVGTARGFTFTHLGFPSVALADKQSILRRTRYYWDESKLWRQTWPALDQAPQTKGHARLLIAEVKKAQFAYVNDKGQWQTYWPEDGNASPLPRAIKIKLVLAKDGEISQTYVIFSQPTSNLPPSAPKPTS